MKRLVFLLILLLLLPSAAFAEAAATPTPALPPVPTPAPAPVVVDRINGTPHTDFAFAEDAPLFEVIFPQILNCDAALLRCGGETMLVDCCTMGQAARIVDMCAQLGITHIDRVVNTHPHEDHIGGLRNLLKAVSVDELWVCFPLDYNKHMVNAVETAKREGLTVHQFADGDVLTLGGATIQVWKKDGDITELNDISAQFFITYGERTFLMAADLEQTGQAWFVEQKGALLDADILKYPHHGLEGLNAEYVKAVSPLFCVVTNNMKNTAGKKYIQNTGLPTAWTVPGFVYLTTDGTTWVCDRIPSIKKY